MSEYWYGYFPCGCAYRTGLYDGDFGCVEQCRGWDIWSECTKHKDLIKQPVLERKQYVSWSADNLTYDSRDYVEHNPVSERNIRKVFYGDNKPQPMITSDWTRHKKYRLDLQKQSESEWIPNPKNNSVDYPGSGYYSSATKQ